MVNYITNDHFWTKNRSWDSKFTILKFSICHHCISLVNGAPKPPKINENLKNHQIQSFFATRFRHARLTFFVSAASTIDGSYKKNYSEHSDMSSWRYRVEKSAIFAKTSKIDEFCCFFNVFPSWSNWMEAHNLVKLSK